MERFLHTLRSFMIQKNQVFIGTDGKASLLDLIIPTNYSGKMIVFIHGYMGFKDWGCWDLVQDYFVKLGFGFCKYNVSHNGCSIENSTEFVDLDSFAINTYTKEEKDFQCVLSFLEKHNKPFPELFVVGHSRGGGIALLQGADKRILKIATWASISNISSRFPSGEALEKWKEEKIITRTNGRTLQEMPLNISQYEDFRQNEKQLNIETSIRKLNKPLLLIHGDNDTSVHISEGQELAKWSQKDLVVIEGANHTFGSSHPWNSSNLPEQLEKTCRITAEFFLKS